MVKKIILLTSIICHSAFAEANPFMVEIHEQPVVSIEKEKVNIKKESMPETNIKASVSQTITTVVPEKENTRMIEVSTNGGKSIDPEQRIKKLENQLTELSKQNETVTELLFEIKKNVTPVQDIILDATGNIIERKNIEPKKIKIETQKKIITAEKAKPKPIKKPVIKKEEPKEKTTINTIVKQEVVLQKVVIQQPVEKIEIKEEPKVIQKADNQQEKKIFKKFSYLFKKSFYLSEDLQMILLENNYRLDWKIKEDQFMTSEIKIDADSIEDLMEILKIKLNIQYKIQDKKVIVYNKISS